MTRDKLKEIATKHRIPLEEYHWGFSEELESILESEGYSTKEAVTVPYEGVGDLLRYLASHPQVRTEEKGVIVGARDMRVDADYYGGFNSITDDYVVVRPNSNIGGLEIKTFPNEQCLCLDFSSNDATVENILDEDDPHVLLTAETTAMNSSIKLKFHTDKAEFIYIPRK